MGFGLPSATVQAGRSSRGTSRPAGGARVFDPAGIGHSRRPGWKLARGVCPETCVELRARVACGEGAVKGDRVEIVVDAGEGNQIRMRCSATRAGRRVEVSTGRGIVEVTEVTRTGTAVRTARFMASRVIALVEHPVDGRRGRKGGLRRAKSVRGGPGTIACADGPTRAGRAAVRVGIAYGDRRTAGAARADGRARGGAVDGRASVRAVGGGAAGGRTTLDAVIAADPAASSARCARRGSAGGCRSC